MKLKYGNTKPTAQDAVDYDRYIDLATNTAYDLQDGEWVMVSRHGVPVDKHGNPIFFRFGYYY